MKQVAPTPKQIGEHIFYSYPFAALTAANISGELVSLLSPILLSLAPAIVDGLKDGDDSSPEGSFLDSDLSSVTPSMMNAFSSLNGNKLEGLMKTLLVKHRNISYEHEQEKTVRWLDEDGLNSVFIGDISDMYVLAIEVIKLNFKGFFKKLGNQFGNQGGLLSKLIPNSSDTSTAADSQI